MSAFAIAHLRSVEWGPEIIEYLKKIDDTLVPHGGAFLIHGSMPEVLEGELPGQVVVIRFPDMDKARAWYDSPAYQAILPLRTRNSDGIAFLVQGVPDGYRAAALAGA